MTKGSLNCSDSKSKQWHERKKAVDMTPSALGLPAFHPSIGIGLELNWDWNHENSAVRHDIFPSKYCTFSAVTPCDRP